MAFTIIAKWKLIQTHTLTQTTKAYALTKEWNIKPLSTVERALLENALFIYSISNGDVERVTRLKMKWNEMKMVTHDIQHLRQVKSSAHAHTHIQARRDTHTQNDISMTHVLWMHKSGNCWLTHDNAMHTVGVCQLPDESCKKSRNHLAKTVWR